MLKVHSWFLFILLLISSFAISECDEDEGLSSIEIINGKIDIGDNSVISFEEAKTTEEKLELKNVRVTTCSESSVWSLSSENATLDESNKE